MTNSRDNDGEGSGENRADQHRQRDDRGLLRRPRPPAPSPAFRPDVAPPAYTPPLPAYPDQRVYNVRMGDQDMQPVSMAPEEAVDHLTSMGFQVGLSERERLAVAEEDHRLLGDAHRLRRPIDRPPSYQRDDRSDGAVLAVRPIEEYAGNQPYNDAALHYMPENVGRHQAPTMGLAIHEREEISGEDRARLLEIQRADRELDWIDGNIAPRYASALEKIGQIYQYDPEISAERSDLLRARVSEFRRNFDESIRNDEDDDLENAPADHRAVQEQARGRELPLSSEARRGVIEELDEMLAEHFPETHAPDRSRPQTPAVAVEAADDEMNDRSRASTVIPDRPDRQEIPDSQEELEQFAQARDVPTPPAPDFRPLEETLPERFAEVYAPDRFRLRTPAVARNAELEVVDLTAEESSQEGSRSRPASRQEESDPFALNEAQHALLAQWPHNRQPTFEEMDRLMSEERRSAPANNREHFSQPENGRARAPKRTRDDAASGDGSPGEGPSRPAQRRRLMPSAGPSSSTGTSENRGHLRQPESGPARPPKRTRDEAVSGDGNLGEGPSRPVQRRRVVPDARIEPGSEPSGARQGGSGTDAQVHARNREDRRNTGVEPAVGTSAESRPDPGHSTARAAQSARQADAWRRFFDDARRGRGNDNGRSR